MRTHAATVSFAGSSEVVGDGHVVGAVEAQR